MGTEAIRLLWVGTALGAGISVVITLIAAAKSISRWSVVALVILGSLFFCVSFYGFAGTTLFFRSRPNVAILIYAFIWTTMFGLGFGAWPKAEVISARQAAKKDIQCNPNIKLIEIKTTELSIAHGKFSGKPLITAQPLPTIVVCFRNQPAANRMPKQPAANAHIIYRDVRNTEIADLSGGVWIGDSSDHATLTVGEKKCLVLLSVANGKYFTWRTEEYHTDSSWMVSNPLFRAVDEEIDGLPRKIIITLLDPWSGKRIKKFVFVATYYSVGTLPTFKLQSAFLSFLRRD